eukprot:CAMPEP_0203699530 /NCGR_PEP_ID=MMETSP0091-20130426/26880_1 /ASSEMBLY_ACC=CAM_ASM_001089 /TAXON_ID=426623 /ORGANISM="Chaetoceros affinis, Strain CCMP159" /LENGTH=335 /DNA_ID=CAMNT_0050572379 /DNA_START=19 /DNA_END=1022 /DNA_ORIENTATION=-
MFNNHATRILRTVTSHHSLAKQSFLFNSKTTTKKALSPLSSSFHTTPITPSNAKLIQQLRKTTGAPMVECKKAISDPEVNGDFDKATEWLRKHGSAKMSSKLAGRDASEGLVGICISASSEKNVASIVRVNSETDFASRSPDFSTLVETVAGATLKIGSSNDIEELKTLPDVQKALDDAIIAIRENLQITSASTITASKPNSVLAGYVHGKIFGDKLAGTAAAIVELAPINSDKETKTNEEIVEIGKKLAMHIVAAKPEYMTPKDVPEDIIQKEKEILMEQMADSGKPVEILEKIVTGRLGKFYQGVCLVEQSHMLEDGNPKVSKALKGHGLELV